jgi:prepilin-type N-terminal cleavage/methylation domain-containing protein
MTWEGGDFFERSRLAGAREPSGFTIVELLVVTSIMAVLFGLILSGVRPRDGAEIRKAAQQFASVLLAAQSRGIGEAKGAAVVLELDTSGESGGMQCTSVFTGMRRPFVVGTVNGGMPPDNPAASTAQVTITPTNGGDLQHGYRVQFFGSAGALPSSAWFAFQPPGTVSLRAAESQSPSNTVWPSQPVGQIEARVDCYPDKSARLLALPKQVGIDLRYSGTGDDPTAAWGGLAAQGDIAVSFDSAGMVEALMRGVGTTAAAARQPVEPVYFLFASRSDIAANRSLANDRSIWVAIQPQTGRVTVSSNVAQPATNQAAVRAARANARAALAVGR